MSDGCLPWMGGEGQAGLTMPVWVIRISPLLERPLLNPILCSYRATGVRLVPWAPLGLPGPLELLALLAQLANKETEESL